MRTLVELLDSAVSRFADQPAVALRGEDGAIETWTYAELGRRSRIAAWRLRALGLERGDRLLTWSPSMPELPAAYFGAMRAGLILVPLDLRMSREAIEGIVRASGATRLLLGGGRDGGDPAAVGLADFPTTDVQAIAAEVDDSFPADWEAQLAAWPAPASDDLFELIFTSGTTGTPKGVMLAHDNVLASIESFHRIIPPLDHRIVSLLPLSHLLEQAVGLFYALDVGASILYVRSRNPRVIFEALRAFRVTSMIVVPQVLDLFWSAIEREVDKAGRRAAFDRLRAIARRLPLGLRRRLFSTVHRQLGGEFRLFVSAGAFLPPALQQGWEDLGVIVLQGYGATETGTGSCTTLQDHGLGTVGRPPEGITMRIAEGGEVQFKGPTLFKGYWQAPEQTAQAFTSDGWYRTGDIGHLDADGRLILSGRIKDIIVLPNGFNVYPEDIENALRVAGIRDSVVLETKPGRIEAIILAPLGTDAAAPSDALRSSVEASVRTANAALGPNQRIAGWRLWPEADFPRTHTLKVRRNQVRDWAAVDAPLPVSAH
ncbi:MAG TPA: AMP-binding protein [Candidatus Limnocylindrales bacterium]|nr:AMP-binding protein [Candidatus Limnocylindrales bacterium]